VLIKPELRRVPPTGGTGRKTKKKLPENERGGGKGCSGSALKKDGRKKSLISSSRATQTGGKIAEKFLRNKEKADLLSLAKKKSAREKSMKGKKEESSGKNGNY